MLNYGYGVHLDPPGTQGHAIVEHRHRAQADRIIAFDIDASLIIVRGHRGKRDGALAQPGLVIVHIDCESGIIVCAKFADHHRALGVDGEPLGAILGDFADPVTSEHRDALGSGDSAEALSGQPPVPCSFRH